MGIETNNPSPLVSVVIPSYNHAKFLDECIQSVKNQDLQNWELIVVDDGSTDDSRIIIQKYVAADSRIRCLFQANAGAAHAINRGVSLARGQYLAILNSDDKFRPQRLSTLYHACQQHGYKFVVTGVTAINGESTALDSRHPWHLQYARMLHAVQERGLLQGLFFGNYTISTSNFFLHRDVWLQLGGLAPLRYNHDWLYAVRALMAYPSEFAFLSDELLLEYRMHGRNTITSNPLRARLELYRMQRTIAATYSPDVEFLVHCIRTNQRSLRRESMHRQAEWLNQNVYQIQHAEILSLHVAAEKNQTFIQDLNLKLSGTQATLEQTQAALEQTQAAFRKVCVGLSYRLGHTLTFPLRYIMKLLKIQFH